ncbi:regulator of G-protein signaling 14 isoform X2 [Pleurodeles waltl]|uniref:regulator of G-protein signaling 14 isoform X2 n=1 Tax=Pleurodeles waltl TaxID=8319 RepID=UPI00370983DB
MDFSFWELSGTRSRLLSLKKKLSISRTFSVNRPLEAGQKLAASDGELSSADVGGRGSNQSLTSLPSVRRSGSSSERAVASWAVSFERLLQDPLGVAYFTEFLKKEFSAENIFFWEACEKFQHIPAEDSAQLAQESRRIYDEYLSSSSFNPVNIDHQAWLGEDMLEKPTPNMFQVQQMQIFNLMKFDSYARFVRSPMYQECMLAEVEGRSLPDLGSTSQSLMSSNSSTSLDLKKKKRLKSGKSLPLGVEVAGAEISSRSFSERCTRRSFKKKDQKEIWGDLSDSDSASSLRRRSQGSLISTASLDLDFLSSPKPKSENHGVSVSSTETDPETRLETGPVKYCCVYLPDGTASLTAVRHGLSIREMLSGICQKRGLCLSEVKLYLMGSKQTLVLDQDSTVLTDQEVMLENRISFELEIPIIKKIVRISAKSAKTVREALQPIAEKYGVSLQQVVLRLSGESNALDLDRPVTAVAGQRLVLAMVSEMDARAFGEAVDAQAQPQCASSPTVGLKHQCSSAPVKKGSVNASPVTRHRDSPAAKNPLNRRTYDIEGLVELLNRVQGCRAEDQRGLLCKKDLVLPDFLQLPPKDEGDPQGHSPEATDIHCISEGSGVRTTDLESTAEDSTPRVVDSDSNPKGPNSRTTNSDCDLAEPGSMVTNVDCSPDLKAQHYTEVCLDPEGPGILSASPHCEHKSTDPKISDLKHGNESPGSNVLRSESSQALVNQELLPESVLCHGDALPDVTQECTAQRTCNTGSSLQTMPGDGLLPGLVGNSLSKASQFQEPDPEQHTS